MYHFCFVYIHLHNGCWELSSFKEPCLLRVATVISFARKLNPTGMGEHTLSSTDTVSLYMDYTNMARTIATKYSQLHVLRMFLFALCLDNWESSSLYVHFYFRGVFLCAHGPIESRPFSNRSIGPINRSQADSIAPEQNVSKT